MTATERTSARKLPADAAEIAGRRALWSLMLASFGIGTGEFVIVGLVPDLAANLDVTVPTAGLLISGYALSVAFGSPVLAVMLAPASRRRALLVLILVFLLGDIGCALAPDFATLMAARIVTALAHGAFFGIASIVAGELAPPGKAVRAVALLFTGLTVANVLGVPAGTWIGQAAGWRVTFGLVAGIAAASLAAIAAWVPGGMAGGSGGLRRELAALREKQIWFAMLVSTLSSAALFTVLTFLTPLLEQVTRLSPHGAGLALLLFGVGLTVGGLAGGRLAGSGAVFAIRALLAADALALALVGLSVHSAWLTLGSVFLWGAAAFALVPPLQHLVVLEARGAPHLASTLNQSAFNIGDALGAALGAACLAHGAAYPLLPWIGAAVVLLAFIPALLSRSRV